MSSTLTNEIEYLEKSMLSKKDLEDYDLERTYYMVIKFLKNYKRLKCKSFNAPQIKVTTKYKYIFVDEPTKSVNEYTKFDEYADELTYITKYIIDAYANVYVERNSSNETKIPFDSEF